jgi:hypothetical protein
MNGYEIESYRQQSQENCQIGCGQSGQSLQVLNPYSSQLGQSTSYWVQTCPCPSLGDYEISIQQLGEGEPLLNYGPKLRLIMAEPLKGIDLREAIAKLKSALKQCKNEH